MTPVGTLLFNMMFKCAEMQNFNMLHMQIMYMYYHIVCICIKEFLQHFYCCSF